MVLGNKKRVIVMILEKLGVCPTYNARDELLSFNAFITPDDEVVKHVATILMSALSNFSLLSIVKAAFDFVALNTKYITDKQHFGKNEWFQYPREMLTVISASTPFSRQMYGDCEDTSFLLASLLIAMGVPEDNVRVGISASHAWVEVLVDGRWIILESTEDSPLSELKTRSDIGYNPIYRAQFYVYHNRCGI